MSKIAGLVFILMSVVQSGWAQNSATSSPSSNPMKDSVDKYSNLGQFGKTIPFAKQWAENVSKQNGEESSQHAEVLTTLGIAWARSGNPGNAEPVLLQALEIRKKVFSENSPEVAKSFITLGNLYNVLGNYPETEKYYVLSYKIRKKILPENHADIGQSLSNLGTLYQKQGNYPKAISYYQQALEIWKKSLGENHPAVSIVVNNLGTLYMVMGNLTKAEPFLSRSLEIAKKTQGDDHPDLVASLSNLGLINVDLGKYDKAESYYLKSLDILKKSFGENHPAIARTYQNLGKMYMELGEYGKSERFLNQAVDIQIYTLGNQHPEVADNHYNMSVLHWKKGNFSNAESHQLEALAIRKGKLGENHPDVASSYHLLGLIYLSNHQLQKAGESFKVWKTRKDLLVQRYLPSLSDNEKEKFYDSNISRYQEDFKSFCIEQYPLKKEISIDLFNDQLAMKGLLLNSSAKWKHRIKTSGDKKLFSLFSEWEANQNKLSKLLQSTDSTELTRLDSVLAQTEKMEEELSLRSENFAKLADKKLVTWKDIQKTLKPGEAAIEMVRIKKFGIRKTVTDTSDANKRKYKIKGLTDTIYYAALIVKPESMYPEMVLLKNGNDLEGRHQKYYQNSISRQLPDNQSYSTFWEKIGARLGTGKRVYFSPDGVFHNINLNTLFNPKTKKYLLDEKDIRLVTVTKDLVTPGPVEDNNKLAELVGFPDYYEKSSAFDSTAKELKSPDFHYGLRLESIGTLEELPGTKTEVDKIADILETKGWEVKNYTGASALEQNVKDSYKPRLVHIATHGFFQADTITGSNPLLHSGLMLTGAGNSLKGNNTGDGEDGILTAYEAMNLNLDNTDLVVLSACETGLGKIKNGEGVYGLQRAFKVAGAKSIIMSLWKVDDEATQELMVSFYKHWLSPLNGSKRAAFFKAQKELKAKYPNPYYWGAFVMVGE